MTASHFYQLCAGLVDITPALAIREKLLRCWMAVSTAFGGAEFTKFRTRSGSLCPAVQLGIFRQWLLGAPGNAVTAGVQPDCGRPYLQALECQRDAKRMVVRAVIAAYQARSVGWRAVVGVWGTLNLERWCTSNRLSIS